MQRTLGVEITERFARGNQMTNNLFRRDLKKKRNSVFVFLRLRAIGLQTEHPSLHNPSAEDLGNLVEAQVSSVSTWLGCQYVAHLCTERHAFPVVNHAQKNQKYVGLLSPLGG